MASYDVASTIHQSLSTGSGFGPPGYQANVFVSVGPESRVCKDVVVELDTKITCNQNPGTGASLDVNVTVTSKDGGTD
jgi:hypothetical protein